MLAPIITSFLHRLNYIPIIHNLSRLSLLIFTRNFNLVLAIGQLEKNLLRLPLSSFRIEA